MFLNFDITMKKVPLFIGVMLIILTVGLSGCTEENSKKGDGASTDLSKFVGTWYGGHWNSSIEDKDETWTFYENDSLYRIDAFDEEWATYELDENGKLCIRIAAIHYLMCYEFTFSNNDTYLTLTLGDITSYRLAKEL